MMLSAQFGGKYLIPLRTGLILTQLLVCVLTMNRKAMGLLFFNCLFFKPITNLFEQVIHTQHKIHTVSGERV